MWLYLNLQVYNLYTNIKIYNYILQERIYKNYHSIVLTPNKFTQYLLSPVIGFHKCEEVSVPAHPSKGFQRPIFLYTKAENPSVRSSADTPRFPSTHLKELW